MSSRSSRSSLLSLSTLKSSYDTLVDSYHRYGDEVKNYWSSFGRDKRLLCTQSHLHDKVDPTGRVFVQEILIAEIIKDGSSYFIELLESRATRTLYDQIFTSYNGWATDYACLERMVVRNEINPQTSIFEGTCITVIDNMLTPDKPSDGRLNNNTDENNTPDENNTKKTGRIPNTHLSLIIQRQYRIFHFLSSTMQDILDLGRENALPGSKATALTIPPVLVTYQPSANHMTNIALDNATIAEEESCYNFEIPGRLKNQMKGFLDCRPELVPDDKGQVTLALAANSIGIALSEILYREVKRAKTWQFIYELLKSLNLRPDDKSFRRRILQQLSNVCQMEYVEAQDLLRRNMQTRSGRMLFRRCPNSFDAMGNPRVVMKRRKPETLAARDTPLCYLLSFCHSETAPEECWQSFLKLQSHYEKHPTECLVLSHEECQAMRVLYTIASFIHFLNLAFRMPSFSRKRENEFVLGMQMEDAKAMQAKPHIDVEEFVNPIAKLQNRKIARMAIGKVAECIENAGGGDLYGNYEALVTRCLLKIRGSSPNSNDGPRTEPHLEATESKPEECTPQAIQVPETVEMQVPIQPQPVYNREQVPFWQFPETEQPKTQFSTTVKKKLKTTCQGPIDKKKMKSKRQCGTTGNNLEQSGSKQTPATTPKAPRPLKHFVSSSAAEVFGTLFSYSVRGKLHWSSFERSMAELGFEITYKYGSAIGFKPPQRMGLVRPLTLHRPHGPCFQGFCVNWIASRLAKAFDWDEGTFVDCQHRSKRR
ncbi:hypothetical protein NQ176_g5289 [Zarea fungicola]|uniref:Uncharacterized protein n=1 Tax=Zarea fungicola TaxID=93591 RepID=A0ACC1N965_9HYPO|nr:hypothetical protein NQ176_g5289 [Lecanicillium fungicola]